MDKLQKTLSLSETLKSVAKKKTLKEEDIVSLCAAAEILEEYASVLKQGEADAAIENGNTKWTEEEERKLAQEYKSGMRIAEITAAHRRSASGIISRLSKLNLLNENDVNGKKRWTGEEEAQLIAEFGEGLELEDLAQKHKRSMSGIIGRLSKLGLTD